MVEPKLSAVREVREKNSPESALRPQRLVNCHELEAVPLTPGYRFAKRATDIIGSLILMLLLSPVYLVIAILVKLSSPGPVFYKSTRVGLCGQPFTFIKFRSMRPDADKLLEKLKEQNEKEGPIFKIKDDPRITPVGKFLRRYSLDELPQLWSVLTGDMSLVGPRPPIPHEVLQYEEIDLQRLRVKPGITCYWQVMGRSRLTFQQWMELDRKYIEDMSLATDLKLMLMTPAAVLKSDGAY